MNLKITLKDLTSKYKYKRAVHSIALMKKININTQSITQALYLSHKRTLEKKLWETRRILHLK